MSANPEQAIFKINAGNVEVDADSLPTSYDSDWPNRIWKNDGVLRVGPSKAFFVSVYGEDTSTFTNSFTTYKFPFVEPGSSDGYDTSTGFVTIPYDGLYTIQGSMRTSGGSTPDRNWGVGVHSSNVDGSHFLWTTTQTNAVSTQHSRTTYPYTRTARFSKDDEVRMYLYVDNGSTGLTMKMGGMTIYRLSD